MQVSIKAPKRGQSPEERDIAIIENRVFSATDIGIYFRIKRAQETEDGLEFYINDRDPVVLESLARLQEFGAIELVW